MKISVLNCADSRTPFENFSRHLNNTECFNIRKEEFPEDPDAVLVTGSSHGVYEDKHWINPLLENLKQYVESSVPVLGICFGHQAVAEALGGKVEYMGEYEIGYKEVRLNGSKLFKNLDKTVKPFSTHQDEVVELPENVEKTAESDVSIHGFEHVKKPVFGVQFHPEYDQETTEKVIRKKGFEDSREQELLNQVTEQRHREAEKTARLLQNFEKIAKQHLNS